MPCLNILSCASEITWIIYLQCIVFTYNEVLNSHLPRLWFFQWSCMDVRVGLWRKLSTEELMLLNCGVGEDSWESLGLQRDPTSPSYRKSVLGVHWKDWCWSLHSNTLVTWCEELTHWKRPWCWEIWKQEEKRMTQDEMVGWHHWLDRHEFE